MKYYWAKWKKRYYSPIPFVIIIDEHEQVFRLCWPHPNEFMNTRERLKNAGLIIGPEIPGPEEWR